MFGWKTAAGAIGTLALGIGILGTSILATNSFAATSAQTAAESQAHPEGEGALATLEAVLDRLVEKGVITQDQEQKILEAVRAARGDHDRGDGGVRHFLGDVLQESSRYLGLSVDDIKDRLAKGQSLGEIARSVPGKSREGLIDFLSKAAQERIRKAVEQKQITSKQAEKLRTTVDAMIVRIVDHERGKKT